MGKRCTILPRAIPINSCGRLAARVLTRFALLRAQPRRFRQGCANTCLAAQSFMQHGWPASSVIFVHGVVAVLTIHGMSNWSMHMPKPGDQNVF
jgi:hypothetical protein